MVSNLAASECACWCSALFVCICPVHIQYTYIFNQQRIFTPKSTRFRTGLPHVFRLKDFVPCARRLAKQLKAAVRFLQDIMAIRLEAIVIIGWRPSLLGGSAEM